MAIPPLPDSERRTEYSPANSLGPFDVTFAIYGDGSDYSAWLEVWLNGVKLAATTDWTLSSPSGTLSKLARPITDAQVTLAVKATGTLEIVGMQRPRRTTQLTEGRPWTATDVNRALTESKAIQRETWDRLSRTPAALPGETVGYLPSLSSRKAAGVGSVFGFDGVTGSPVAIPLSATLTALSAIAIGLTTIIGGANGNLLYNNNGVAGETNAPTLSRLTITPTSTASAAFTLTQNGAVPASGVFPGLYFNQTFSGSVGGTNFNQVSINDFTSAPAVGISLNHGLFAPWSGQKVGIWSDIYVAQDPGTNPGPTGIPVALNATVRGLANVNPTYNIGLFAFNPGVTVTGTGYGTLVGAEFDMVILAGGSAQARIGIQVLGDGIAGLNGTDYAYVFGSNTDAATWDYGITWYGRSVKATTGTLFGSVNATNAKYGIDLNNVTFASGGFAFRSPFFSVDDTGRIIGSSTIITSSAFNALAVGPQGGTFPTLRVISSNPNTITGLQILGNASGGGLDLSVTGSSNENLSLNASGTGAIAIGGGSTGNVIVGTALNYGGVTLTFAVTGTGKMVLDTNATLANPTFTTPTLGVASATSLALSGTAGAGFVNLLTQSANPSAPASGFAFFADASGRLSWRRQSDTFVRTFDAVLTANRVFTLPDVSDTFAMLAASQTLTNKTLTAPAISGGTGFPYILAASAVESAVHTGDLLLTTLATIVVPANTLGANGRLRITVQWRFTGTAGTKTGSIAFGGTNFFQLAYTASALSGSVQREICNRNATNSQVSAALTAQGPVTSTSDIVTAAIDTTSAQNILLTGQLANAGDSIAVESYLVEVIKT